MKVMSFTQNNYTNGIPLWGLSMEYDELMSYYKNKGVLNRILKERNITPGDVFFRSDHIIGLWDYKNDKPMKKHSLIKVKIRCNKCNKQHELSYKHWERKSEDHKFLCDSCGRSETLTGLNKGIIKENNIRFWKSEEAESLRTKFSSARADFNRGKLRDININKSNPEKEVIKKKKQATWYSKPIDERIFITNKRLHGVLKGYEENTGIRFDSSYEKFFIEKCNSSGLNIARGPVIPYVYNNNLKMYYCDFIVNNYLVEIKSQYTYKKFVNNKREAAMNYCIEFGHKDYIIIIITKGHIQGKEELNLNVFKNQID